MRGGASADARTRPPVLFLTGVGLTAAVALRSIAELSAHFQVLAPALERQAITHDGTGDDGVADQSTADGPSRAGDETILALLDAAGAEQVHVVGLSFGAALAQRIAIEHPERVRALVLGSSTAGGERYAAPAPVVRDFVRRLTELPAEEGLWASVPYLYAARTSREDAPLIGQDIAQRLRRPLDPHSYRRQHALARAHDAGARLSEIKAPTLVVHGEQDRILPLENGRRLADGIARARFMPLPGGAHAFPTDVPGANRELVSFLLAHSPRRAGPAAPRSGRAARA